MATTESSASAHPSTREVRGLALAEEHFEEIAASYRSGTYLVPSGSGRGSYRVTYIAREEECGCRDWAFGHTCKHVLAVAVVAAKTRACDGCGARVRRGELVEVQPERAEFGVEVLEGQRLCWRCARERSVL